MATLIAHGADVNARADDGWTPLMYASARGHMKVAEALLDAGADKELKDDDGVTALEIARENKRDDVKALIRRR